MVICVLSVKIRVSVAHSCFSGHLNTALTGITFG